MVGETSMARGGSVLWGDVSAPLFFLDTIVPWYPTIFGVVKGMVAARAGSGTPWRPTDLVPIMNLQRFLIGIETLQALTERYVISLVPTGHSWRPQWIPSLTVIGRAPREIQTPSISCACQPLSS